MEKEMMFHNFFKEEATIIYDISIEGRGKEDKLAWLFTKDSYYIIKSGY